MTRAAEMLHVTQPALSKQMQRLEDELGQKLFIRHSFSIELSDAGMLLRKRAEDIVSMADKMLSEFSAIDEVLGGNIYLGCAESYQIHHLAKVIRDFKELYPDFHYHITSGDTEQVTEKLDKGILDFAVIVEEPDRNKYNVLKMPDSNTWGAVMRTDHPLSEKEFITCDDLLGVPLFCSEQSWQKDIPAWCGDKMRELTLEGTFRLAYNGSVFASEGLGVLLTFDNLVDTSAGSGLCFRTLYPTLHTDMYVIWRKRHMFTPIAEKFLEKMQKAFLEE